MNMPYSRLCAGSVRPWFVETLLCFSCSQVAVRYSTYEGPVGGKLSRSDDADDDRRCGVPPGRSCQRSGERNWTWKGRRKISF